MKNLLMCAFVCDADAQSEAQIFHRDAAFEWSSRLAIAIFSSLTLLSPPHKQTDSSGEGEGERNP